MDISSILSGGTRELVIDGSTGWLLDENASPEALSRCMREAIARPEEARSRAKCALASVSSRFTLASMAARYLEILDAERGAGHEKMSLDERPYDTRTHRGLLAGSGA